MFLIAIESLIRLTTFGVRGRSCTFAEGDAYAILYNQSHIRSCEYIARYARVVYTVARMVNVARMYAEVPWAYIIFELLNP